MKEIRVSDEGNGGIGVAYLSGALKNTLADFKGYITSNAVGDRNILKIKIDKEYGDYLRYEIEDKISEVIAIKYKYDFFKNYIRAEGLDADETEILFSALIAADIDEDKAYVSNKLKRLSEYAIDGVYNFRLSALKRKWSDIVGYIPAYFEKDRLTDFVAYLTGEKVGKAVTVEDGVVFDRHYNVLNRTALTGGGTRKRIVREAILSGCGEVRITGKIAEDDEDALNRFFPNRVYTAK